MYKRNFARPVFLWILDFRNLSLLPEKPLLLPFLSPLKVWLLGDHFNPYTLFHPRSSLDPKTSCFRTKMKSPLSVWTLFGHPITQSKIRPPSTLSFYYERRFINQKFLNDLLVSDPCSNLSSFSRDRSVIVLKLWTSTVSENKLEERQWFRESGTEELMFPTTERQSIIVLECQSVGRPEL